MPKVNDIQNDVTLSASINIVTPTILKMVFTYRLFFNQVLENDRIIIFILYFKRVNVNLKPKNTNKCWVWSLIIFFIQRYHHIGPQFIMWQQHRPLLELQGGSRGWGWQWSLGAPPGEGLGAVPPKQKIDVEFPCKML